MSLPGPDSFSQFARDNGLSMTAEALYVAPRDVMYPPSDSDQPYLVTLTRSGTVPGKISLVFQTPLAHGTEPTIRDVLWWLASDAWAIDRSQQQLDRWAAIYAYDVSEPATRLLFECHVRQAVTLADVLGPDRFQQLLQLYEVEVTRPNPLRAGQVPEQGEQGRPT